MGIKAAPFKVGPDFIDPGHHAAVSGRTSYNLDSWMLSKSYNQELFVNKSRGADIAVVEGVMGLFDGIDGESDDGSTAQMAKWLGLPVLLVVSATGKARSAAAIVKGFETFDPDLRLAGVVFSKTGSLLHYQYLKKSVELNCKTPCLGYLPQNDALIMPERHLGLVTADEACISDETISLLSSLTKEHMDISGLIKGLAPIELSLKKKTMHGEKKAEDSPSIAVARDKAFCFYYPDNLEMLKACGATLKMFSPLYDDRLPDDIDGIYLGGGYPEVFAEKLSHKKELLCKIKTLSDSGMPIYGECGGFMFLCSRVLTPKQDQDKGQAWDMSGCFEFSVQMFQQLKSLGYREITLNQDTIIGKKGDVLRGHEFHYSSLKDPEKDISNVYQVSSGPVIRLN